MRPSGHNHTGRDRGETLIELLMALAIMAVVVTAIVNALVTAISTSRHHRQLATLDTLVRSYAETATSVIQLQNGNYVDCAGAAAYQGSITAQWSGSVPTGYSVAVSAVAYWNGSTFTGTCPAPDKGLQRVTIRGAVNGVMQTLDVVVRRP